MKKTLFRFPALFLAILVLFIGLPFNSLNKVNAAEANIVENFVDFLRTNLGMAQISNGSLAKVERYDFYKSLYNTPLVWTYNGEDFNFIPSSYFNSLENWITVCNPNNQSGSFDPQFADFDIKECLIKSGYIRDTGSGYDLSNMPKLGNFVDTVSPLDGIEIIYDFSNYNNYLNLSYRSANNIQYFDSIKNAYLSNDYPLIILSGALYNTTIYNYFFSFNSDYVFYFDYMSNDRFYPYFVIKTPSGWSSFDFSSTELDSMTSYTDINNSDHIYNLNRATSDFYNKIDFTQSDFSNYSKLSVGTGRNTTNLYESVTIDNINVVPNFWSNYPIIHASNQDVGMSFYTWLRGTPNGSFYSTANTQTIYDYDYVTNNNWETAYNNYITDVSNYYSTTENITNEQLTQYIDNSITITNITNNYIDNSGSGSGGENPDSGIIISWLEKIFDRVTDIYNIILGRDSEGDIIYNNNSIRYSIIEYPLSDLFPSVPQSRFIPYSDIFDFGIAQNHLNSVMRQIIPFCYLYQLQTIATALQAPPETPHYEIPFTIERLNIDEEIIIDLSAPAWTTLHSIWITLFTIMLITALLYATYKFLILLNSIFG